MNEVWRLERELARVTAERDEWKTEAQAAESRIAQLEEAIYVAKQLALKGLAYINSLSRAELTAILMKGAENT